MAQPSSRPTTVRRFMTASQSRLHKGIISTYAQIDNYGSGNTSSGARWVSAFTAVSGRKDRRTATAGRYPRIAQRFRGPGGERRLIQASAKRGRAEAHRGGPEEALGGLQEVTQGIRRGLVS